MNLSGRRALITGAAGHIGSVIAQTLAELGAGLVLVDRPGANFRALSDAVVGIGSSAVQILECDLESQTDRDELLERVIRGPEVLDVLVNNAAFVGTTNLDGWIGDLPSQTTACWRRALEVNLTAVFDLCRGLAPLLMKTGRGSIVNIASIYGSSGPDHRLYAGTTMGNPAAYAASKGGLIQLSRWLATTLAPSIRVNCISPGGVLRDQPEIFVKRYEAHTPLGRMATEDDLRGAIAYLATDLSAYCTGHDLVVDGGWSAW
jgi:NAD(P)-dependent dehydrogenase (short-subunit alcohol dehydrogenase family)